MIDLENKMDALLDEIREMIREKRYADLRDMFLPMESADIAQILEEAGPEVMPLLYRLLFNLTENAIRYGRPDGAVRIAVSEADGNVQIRVRDHGPGIPEAELPLFRALPGRVEITEEENFADYLYSAEEMIRLSGKKFSGQRNHISRFLRTCQSWSFEPLDNTDAAEVETFFHTLNKKLNYTPGEAAEENHKVQEVLEHLDQYGLVGGVLRADGAIVGFTLGEVLRDTLYIHIEKADRDYPGAYQMLCRQFCAAYADGLAYVNREEDMGDLGLRKAKRDLHPVTQLKKYTVEVW